MIRLNLPKEPYWLELPGYSIRLKVRPLTTALFEAARARAIALMRHARDGAQVPDDADTRDGMALAAVIEALASLAIVEWEGVFESSGDTPAPVTRDSVGEFVALFPLGKLFYERYTASLDALDAEKNVFAPAPNGTSAAGSATAGDAPTTTSPAAAASPAPADGSAPTSSTRH